LNGSPSNALMDDREFPPNDLRIDSKDSLSADCRVEGLASHLVSSSDENENQLDRDGNEVLTSSDTAMGRQNEDEQDSINNNENTDSGGCAPSCKESETERRSVSVHVEPQLEKKTVTEKQAGGKRSPRSKRGSSKKSKGAPSVGTIAVKEENTLVPDPVCAEGHEANEDSCQQEQKQTLPSLFSLLRDEVEQMDSKILPLCLHQIAETYFQEEEYEKAMKFIQLERLYHEQLLANLSSIQEQWERKWKATVPGPVTAVRNSAKELSNEELEKLTRVCSSHQQPLACKHKLVAAENTWESSRFLQLTGSERLKEREAAAFKSGTETFPGGGPEEEDTRPRAGSRGEGRTETPPEAASPRAAAGKAHMEEQEQQRSTEPALEPHAQATGRGGRPPPDCLSSGDAGKDNRLQPREGQLSKDVGKIEEAAGEPGVKLSMEPMVDTLLLTDAGYMPPDLLSAGEDVQADRNLLASKHVAGSSETAGGQLGNSDLNQQQKQLDDGGKSPQDRTASNMCPGSNQVSEQESTSHSRVCKEMQNTAGQEEEKVNHEEQEDLFLRFLNGNIIDSEESFADLTNEEDFDTVPDISPERASYSSLEALSLDDSFSSLDELARRIEIAEIAPAEGLVSILKKRDDREGKTIAQVQQRQTKRRVRFQEMEDTLDQDEAAGGSCILLVLLCIATVFLSVGGTALYCTFGDMESPMCKDFAANVDFYYTQILQRMEELKHWVAFS
ncbi:CNST protein, partial [Nothoprocta pentlandii]|nr:CNST protein [Nothoprocta pentlandii]